MWLAPPALDAAPLTVEAMAERLRLTDEEQARIQRLMDSLHVDVVEAARFGPDSLRVAADRVHRRLEEALPAEARPTFRSWLSEHHEEMMRRVGHDPGGASHR